MPGGIDGIGLPQSGPRETDQTSFQQPVTVETRGQTVVVQPTISSLVQDAQEEVTVLLQEKASTTLGRRDAKSRSSSRMDEIARKYLEKVWNIDATRKFQQTLDSLKNLGQPTAAQVRQQLQQMLEGSEGGSEAGLLLALEEVLAAEGGRDDLLAAVREAKAGLGNDLRQFYQEQVKTWENVGDVYQQLLGEYGEEDFLKATDLMIHRLGDELRGQRSTTDSNQTKATVDSLYNLEVARNTYSEFSKLVEKMKSQFGVFPTAA